MQTLFASPPLIFTCSLLLRLVLLCYGIYQDAHSALKYTDIDYYVFTDAARYLSRGRSPYDRSTYRYTPLLAWILLPTSWGGLWFHSGKALFAVSDIIVGWLIWNILKRQGLSSERALKYASVWLLNPMVANISTRGSSEGLLCVLVMALLWAFEVRRIALAGMLLGTSVHFKIYPFIYGASMIWALEEPSPAPLRSISSRLLNFLNRQRLVLIVTSLTTFIVLNFVMYSIYGAPFVEHTFTYHLTRLDHRHNFSLYNTLLYTSSATPDEKRISPASLAFLPQLILSCILIPLSCAKTSLPSTLLAQTLAFVSFNKVATSQYFLWYLVFLPLYLPTSSFRRNPVLGLVALALWIITQALWLWFGYRLEFLGESTFVPGLFGASLLFFLVNCWILGVVVSDIVTAQPKEIELNPAEKRADEARVGMRSGSGVDKKDRILVMPPVEGIQSPGLGARKRGKETGKK